MIYGFYDEIAAFAKGYVARIIEQVKQKETNNAKKLENVPASQG